MKYNDDVMHGDGYYWYVDDNVYEIIEIVGNNVYTIGSECALSLNACRGKLVAKIEVFDEI